MRLVVMVTPGVLTPRADMQAFYAQEMRRLNSAGWIDKAHGTVHIPISDAMQKIARDGIPGWPGPSETQR